MMKPNELFGSKLRFDDEPKEVEDTVAHLKDLQLQLPLQLIDEPETLSTYRCVSEN